MDRQITHPTKEQVRAYMAGRETARRPPPPPAEIRRQLGWRLTPPSNTEHPLLQFCLLPSTCSQLTAQLVLDWLFASSRAIAATRTR
jgi:hypothetical protein